MAPDEPGGPSERYGTFYALEDVPPLERPRWFCHWNGRFAPGFEDIDDAIAWGLERAETVQVRTHAGDRFWVGTPPTGEGDLRPWPPSAEEKSRIDADHAAAVAAVLEENAAQEDYVRRRDRWLTVHAPTLVGRDPAHLCSVLVPGGDDVYIQFEDLADDRDICGARRQRGGQVAFGSAEHVIAQAVGRDPSDSWVVAVLAAIGRGRALAPRQRRPILEVQVADGQLFHVTASANRTSILRHGLDWLRMGAATGIAGSREPEAAAVFLCSTRRDVDFFLRMARFPADVWAVRCDGRHVENGPQGLVDDPRTRTAGASRARRG